jgi:hypothetical protein
MKNMRLASLLLALALLVCTLPAAAYNSGSLVPQKRTYSTAFDDTKGTWCDDAVKTCYEAGLIDGKSAVRFDPRGSLTYAQITVMSARFRSLLTGGTGVFAAPAAGAAWYQPYYNDLMGALEKAGVTAYPSFLEADSIARSANAACPRGDFVAVLAVVLESAKVTLPAKNQIKVVPDSIDETVLGFYNAGILTGSDAYGTLHGTENLNRGQAAAMLARIVDPAQRKSLTLKTFDLSRDIYGIAPETAVLTVDGRSVTMAQFAPVLTDWLTAADKGAAGDALKYAVAEIQTDFAMEKLAAQHGVDAAFTDQDLVAAFGEMPAGYLGVTAAGWLWQYRYTYLDTALQQAYSELYTDEQTAYTNLTADLSKIAVSLKAVSSAKLTGLNLTSALARLNASPYAAAE